MAAIKESGTYELVNITVSTFAEYATQHACSEKSCLEGIYIYRQTFVKTAARGDKHNHQIVPLKFQQGNN
jgi:hypothetical protein